MFFKLFANCLFVKGFSRILLCDLQKERSHFVPHDLYELSLLFSSHTIAEIKSKYDDESVKIIDQYLHFLITNEFGFICSDEERKLFPPLSLEWDYPGIITNAIIDVNHKSQFDFHEIFRQLEILGCRDVQIRIYDMLPVLKVKEILNCVENRTVKSIQLFIKHDPILNDNDYIVLFESFPRMTGLFIHSAEVDEILKPLWAPVLTVAKIKNNIDSHKHCGIIDELFFTTTVELFTESQQHNTCLNRKISLDVEGNIKNCPSMKESYGNIRETTFEEALTKKKFKKYWAINKDQILVCKDCEFRHICTDCRAFLENPEDNYSKPLKCGYDPYTSSWSEWSCNPLKQQALKHYQL